MYSYDEYFIRCMTCGEQIACKAALYNELRASGSSPEEALNFLGITEECSRSAMLNPPKAFFNMENREVIEGFRSVEATDEPNPFFDADLANDAKRVFTSCLCQGSQSPQNIPVPVPVAQSARRLANVPMLQNLLQPNRRTNTVQDIIINTELDKDLDYLVQTGAISEGIYIDSSDTQQTFEEPTAVGIPTINQNPIYAQPLINVGAGKRTRILDGRTYLAQ